MIFDKSFFIGVALLGLLLMVFFTFIDMFVATAKKRCVEYSPDKDSSVGKRDHFLLKALLAVSLLALALILVRAAN